MKTNTYKEPMMKVVKLQQQTHLLSGSGESRQASVQDYHVEESQNW